MSVPGRRSNSEPNPEKSNFRLALRAPCVRGLVPLLLILLTLGCAGIRAILPVYTDIEPTDVLPIDGEYRLMENGKRFRLSQGRMWLLEEAFVGPLRYDPGQVTLRNLMQTGPTTFTGQDLGSMGPATITLEADRVLIDVRSPVGHVEWTLVPIQLDDPAWYSAQLASETVVARTGGSAPSSPGFAATPGIPGMALAPQGDSAALSNNQRARFGGYHALVIGNNRYRSLPPLGTAINDAESISRLLRNRYGFQVELLTDATRAQILQALRAKRETLTAGDNLLIYYAGHGWLDEDADEGYWLPVDAEQDSDVHWISNATITSYLRSIQAKHVMIVADSCYSGTLTRGIKLDVKAPDYLERMAQSRARIVLSSGGLEPVADGGGGGQHSAFARHFIDELERNQGVLDSTTLYARIRRPVMLAADQAPELADIRKAGHEGGDFLFVPTAASPSFPNARP